jgi:hypothetical protein
VLDGGVVLDLIDESRLDGEDGGHDKDHGEEQGLTTKAVDENPGNKGSDEEPGVEKTSHEAGEVLAEADGLLEQGPGIL